VIVLIGYDGSKSSEAAIDDLVHAGLPEDTQAQVIAVAESWALPVQPPDGSVQLDTSYRGELAAEDQLRSEQARSEAKMLVRFAEGRVRKLFPTWRITSCAAYGSPAGEILRKAEEMLADLIVVGSYGHSTLSRFILGSTSQKVLAEAKCSVRVARGRIDVDSAPVRMIIGFDGSRGAMSAIEKVAKRRWTGGQVRLVAVTESSLPTAITRFVPPVATIAQDLHSTDRLWLEKLGQRALERLRGAGLEAELSIFSGNPREVLTEQAERWGADCIFVGANRFGSKLERLVLGSTSAAVAARAGCSVEVVRDRYETDTRQEMDDVVNNWRSLK
jgi:nucleotide-binding universal stress UspA family protein